MYIKYIIFDGVLFLKKSLFIQINTLLSGISGLLTAVILFLLVCTQSASGSFDFSSDNSSFAAEEFESGSYALNCTFGNLNFHRKRGFPPVWKVTGAVPDRSCTYLKFPTAVCESHSETELFFPDKCFISLSATPRAGPLSFSA